MSAVIEGQLDLAGSPVQTDAERREAWLVEGLREIAGMSHDRFVSADDLRYDRPTLAESCPSPSLWGTLFRHAASAGLIHLSGYQESTTPSRKGGVQRLWRRT